MTEPIIGWRAWNLMRPVDSWDSADFFRLLAEAESFREMRQVAADALEFNVESWGRPGNGAWKPRIAEPAACYATTTWASPHSAPGPKCMCGYWAFRTLEDLWAVATGPILFGEVAMWGRVREHKYGYRSEYAYPVSFHTTKAEFDAEVEKAAERFGVPFVQHSPAFENEMWAKAMQTELWTERYADGPSIFVSRSLAMPVSTGRANPNAGPLFWGSGVWSTQKRKKRWKLF